MAEPFTESDLHALGLPPLPEIKLDELLQELLRRVSEVMSSRERIHALLDAVVGIGTDLELHATLQRIAEAACRLTDAKYGALGVLGPDRTLVDFITHGIHPAMHAKIGDLPSGYGVLGLLIADPRPIRLPEITEHSQAFGFPQHHPPMRTFLGVPVRVRDQIYGNLYLAEKNGGGQFTEDDEEIIVALAIAAGTAIDNARLYAQTRRRQHWLEASAEITAVLLGDVQRRQALELIASRAREVAEADLAMVLLYDTEIGELTVEVADGITDQCLVGMHVDAERPEMATVITDRRLTIVPDVGKVVDWSVDLGMGSALLIPLSADYELLGVLVISYRKGTPVPMEETDIALVETFAGQAALALERSRAREEREMLAVLRDRERIARDLHDVVIQRLFAAGMQLQTTAKQATGSGITQRINEVVDDLDGTIRDIRGAIFELRTPVRAVLRTELRELIDESERTLGFRPTLTLDGPVDSTVPDAVRPELLAVLREALSNAARHSRANRIEVSVKARRGRVVLTVMDNGVGGASPKSGLVNLAQRAASHEGGFDIAEVEPTGTRLSWWIPAG